MCTKKEELWFIKVCFIIEFQPFEKVKTNNWLHLFLFKSWILIKKKKKKNKGKRDKEAKWGLVINEFRLKSKNYL